MKVKKVFWGMLAAVMILAVLPADKVSAEETSAEVIVESRTGYQPMELKGMGTVGADSYKSAVYSATEASYWDNYGSDYFYNRMNSNEKAFYDKLYAVCMKYLTTTVDMPIQDWGAGDVDYILDKVSCGSLSVDEAAEVAQILQMQNPQFYFISDGILWGSDMNGNPVLTLCAYGDFADGTVREAYTNQMKSTLDAWMAVINQQSSVVEREKKAHDLIVSKVDYNFGKYDQSCASVFFEDYTVCAGYAEAFTLLCNGAGIETISVTSDTHEWNKVRLYGRWYAVDCTWDDEYDTYYNYDYFNKSDVTLAVGNWDHELEGIWNGRGVPVCSNNTVITTGVYMYGGLDYSSVFNEDYYLNRYPDIKSVYGYDTEKVFHHFVTQGMKEGRQGCESFSVTSYRCKYADLRQAFGNDLRRYYLHYITNGKREGRVGTGTTTIQNPTTKYNGVDYAAVYNFEYYTTKYSDMKRAFGNDDYAAIAHFVNYGMKEGRQGSADFSVTSYRYQYADLRRAFGTNLKSYYMHYITNGRREGRAGIGTATLQNAVTRYNGVDYSAIYDYNYYVTKYPDIKRAYGSNDAAVLAHFVNQGMREGRQGNASFNVWNYRNRYADLRNAYGNNWKAYYMHYLNYGRFEGRAA